jgi:hypothetical protein
MRDVAGLLSVTLFDRVAASASLLGSFKGALFLVIRRNASNVSWNKTSKGIRASLLTIIVLAIVVFAFMGLSKTAT